MLVAFFGRQGLYSCVRVSLYPRHMAFFSGHIASFWPRMLYHTVLPALCHVYTEQNANWIQKWFSIGPNISD